MMTATTKGFAKVMKHDISARDFYDAILLVLGQLGGFQPNHPIAHADAYDPIFKARGVTRDQYGKQDNTGAWWVERWVQEATKALSKKGLLTRPARGMWALTPNGASKAQTLNMGKPVAPVAPVVPVAAVADKPEPAPKKTPKAKTTPVPTGMSVAVSRGMTESDKYHSDPYIRALAAQAAPCMGYFSAKAPKCKDCPLQAVCINATAAEFTRIAVTLAKEDVEAERAEKMANAPAAPKPAKSAAPAPKKATVPTPASASGGAARIVRASTNANCAKCGNLIKAGEEVKWVRAQDGPDAGLYHLACYGGA